jgi:hypothetical protein
MTDHVAWTVAGDTASALSTATAVRNDCLEVMNVSLVRTDL